MQEENTQTVRYRETEASEPSGFLQVVHKRTRVVEGPGPIPPGAEPTTDETHDWEGAK
jgi:hypothetical protein